MVPELEGENNSNLSDRDQLLIELADRFLLDPGVEDADLITRASGTLTAAQIVDLAFLLIKSRAFSQVTMALGLEPEEMDTTEAGFEALGWQASADEAGAEQ